jgi:chitodextrinase
MVVVPVQVQVQLLVWEQGQTLETTTLAGIMTGKDQAGETARAHRLMTMTRTMMTILLPLKQPEKKNWSGGESGGSDTWPPVLNLDEPRLLYAELAVFIHFQCQPRMMS